MIGGLLMLLKKFRVIAFLLLITMCMNVCVVAEENSTTTEDDLVEVAAGNSYSAVLKSDGTVWMWGYNNRGQLGNGTTTDSDTPAAVTGLSNVEHIAAGKEHMLALKTDGTVWAWGYNNYGQLGNDTTTNATTPVQVKTATGNNLSDIVEISAGEAHSLALKADGTVWAWGCNTNGRLGDGTQTHSHTAIQVTGLSGITDIAAGGRHNLAIKNDGTVWAWGYNNYGQLGINSTANQYTPIEVLSLNDIESIDCGANHSFALNSNGVLYGFGRNDFGQLGTGDYTARILEPKDVMDNVVYISAGENVSFFVLGNGIVGATGYNNYGQLGVNNLFATKINEWSASGIEDVESISIGTKDVLALKKNNTLWGWGNNDKGQIDSIFEEKRGVPRILKNTLNDKVGNSIIGSKELNGNSGQVRSTIEYENDIDMFKISPASSGKMFITYEATNPINLKKQENSVENSSNLISSGKEDIVSFNVTANENYYISVDNQNICNYSIKYDIIPLSDVLEVNMSESAESILFTGDVGANEIIQMTVYDPSNSIIDTKVIQVSTDGQFNISYLKENCIDNGIYQFIFSSSGRRNTVNKQFENSNIINNLSNNTVEYNKILEKVREDYSIIMDVEPINPVVYEPQNNDGSDYTGSIKANAYSFTASISNSLSKPIKIQLVQFNKNGEFKKLWNAAGGQESNDNTTYEFCINTAEITPSNDTFCIIACDAESGAILDYEIPAQQQLLSADTQTVFADVPVDYELQNMIDTMIMNSINQTETELQISNINNKKYTEPLVSKQTRSLPEGTANTIYATMTGQYQQEYYEGIFQYGDVNLTSQVFNDTDMDMPVTFIAASFKPVENGTALLMTDLRVTTGEISPFMSDNFEYSREIDSDYYNSCEYFRTFTWDSLAQINPYGLPIEYNKQSSRDNYAANFAFAPLFDFETPIHGIINESGDYYGGQDIDVFTIRPDNDGTVDIMSEPIIGDELTLTVYNEYRAVHSNNQESFEVEAGRIYYIAVTADPGTEYTISFTN